MVLFSDSDELPLEGIFQQYLVTYYQGELHIVFFSLYVTCCVKFNELKQF